MYITNKWEERIRFDPAERKSIKCGGCRLNSQRSNALEIGICVVVVVIVDDDGIV